MPKTQTFVLQLWQDRSGLWVVLKDEERGQLHQFENLEALTQFLSQFSKTSPEPSPTEGMTVGLE